MSTRQTLIPINFLQQIVRFCSRFSKFHTEFHIDAVLHVNTDHDSDGEQIRDPLQAKAVARLPQELEIVSDEEKAQANT